ncbi:MAG: thiamine-phosphate kinase, partial [Gallionella sp.]|nr:thiamine-phosphate kinase [Gallionella sp.]
MLVGCTHFFADADPYLLGHKTLAVNLSDMAAMGALPRWATLALALPYKNTVSVNDPSPTPTLPRWEREKSEVVVDDVWLEQFSAGFFALAQQHGVELVGGDTTRGPLNLCVTIMGEVPQGKALRRDGAQVGDEVWVSGTLGDAALGLAHLQAKIVLPEDTRIHCLAALHQPAPRVALGLALRGVATSAIDISDGLLSDLGHILERSQVGAEVDFSLLPTSDVLRSFSLSPNLSPACGREERDSAGERSFMQHCLLSGGDDYELCFTAPIAHHAEILRISEKLNLPLTRIGKIVAGQGCVVHDVTGNSLNVESAGYDHFR